jgi:uncharacterized iron-regulated membrane protein
MHAGRVVVGGLGLVLVLGLAWVGYAYMTTAAALTKAKAKQAKTKKENPVQHIIETIGGAAASVYGDVIDAETGGIA